MLTSDGIAPEGFEGEGFPVRRAFAGVDLRDVAAVRTALEVFEAPRKPHTAAQSQMAYRLGKMFHHAPAPLRVVRDLVLDPNDAAIAKVTTALRRSEPAPGQ